MTRPRTTALLALLVIGASGAAVAGEAGRSAAEAYYLGDLERLPDLKRRAAFDADAAFGYARVLISGYGTRAAPDLDGARRALAPYLGAPHGRRVAGDIELAMYPKPDYGAALKHYDAGSAADPDALAMKGYLIASGLGTRQNENEGRRLLTQAMQKGSGRAAAKLALLSAEAGNEADAAKWIRVGVSRGDAQAQLLLGSAALDGLYGIKKSSAEAYRAYLAATAGGELIAARELAALAERFDAKIAYGVNRAVARGVRPDLQASVRVATYLRDGVGVKTDRRRAAQILEDLVRRYYNDTALRELVIMLRAEPTLRDTPLQTAAFVRMAETLKLVPNDSYLSMAVQLKLTDAQKKEAVAYAERWLALHAQYGGAP